MTVDQATYTAFTKTYPEGDLWWRVQAIDGNNNRLSWSETRKIVKATPAANLDPNTTAVPERSAVDPVARPAFNSRQAAGSTLFRWSAEDFDASWELQVYKNDDTVPSSGNLVFSTVTKQAAFVPAAPLPPSSEPYRWRVRRTDVGAKAGRWSDLGRFYVDPLPVQLTSPFNVPAVQPMGTTFRWASYGHAAARASKYTIDIEPVTSGATNPAAVTTAATAWSSPANLANGTYTWSVRALDVAGNSIGSSPTWTFTVDAGLRAVTPTQIAAPEGWSVGKTLTSVAPLWNQPDVQVTYQWLRNGSAIRNAVGPTYTLTTDDYTRVVSLRVSGTKPGYLNGESVSNEIGVTAGGALQSIEAPTITGSATGGSLKATSGSWSPAATAFRYQWRGTGDPIPSATGATYRVPRTTPERTVAVTVLGFGDGLQRRRGHRGSGRRRPAPVDDRRRAQVVARQGGQTREADRHRRGHRIGHADGRRAGPRQGQEDRPVHHGADAQRQEDPQAEEAPQGQAPAAGGLPRQRPDVRFEIEEDHPLRREVMKSQGHGWDTLPP